MGLNSLKFLTERSLSKIASVDDLMFTTFLESMNESSAPKTVLMLPALVDFVNKVWLVLLTTSPLDPIKLGSRS